MAKLCGSSGYTEFIIIINICDTNKLHNIIQKKNL